MRTLAKASAGLVLAAALVTAYGASSRETVDAAPATMASPAPSPAQAHADACARFSWPNIPHECIEGAPARAVRSVRNVEVQPRLQAQVVRF